MFSHAAETAQRGVTLQRVAIASANQPKSLCLKAFIQVLLHLAKEIFLTDSGCLVKDFI
jgi:hypothetical protein